jgi:hypothetical protein
MSDKGEHNTIRFPRKAREYLGFSDNAVVLGKGEYRVALTVKKAFKEDVRRLADMIRSGRVSEKEAVCLGFVTRTVQQRINRKKGSSVWVSSGIGDIMIGADPEFGLVYSDGTLHRGNHVVPHDGPFGSDGPGVEVRPGPNRNHLAIVKNIKEILEDPPPEAEPYKWRGGATYKDQNRVYWFGGHIHLGRPQQIEADYVQPIYQRIATALDGLLALPIVRFDAPEPYRRRAGCKYGYGKAGDIRFKEGYDRFEYRVLSGLWVVHPTLAKIALGAAKCVTESAYNRIANQKYDFEWAQAPASQRGLLKSFGLSNIRTTQALINRAQPGEVSADNISAWRRQVRQLDFFDNYSEEWEALMALAEGGPVDFGLDLRENWLGGKPALPKHQTSAKTRKALKAVEEK